MPNGTQVGSYGWCELIASYTQSISQGPICFNSQVGSNSGCEVIASNTQSVSQGPVCFNSSVK